ncbi:MAG: UDP-N-acetylmuramoyl-tripeptide--D-alanyl-D-alanine ligase [Sphingobium sp.]
MSGLATPLWTAAEVAEATGGTASGDFDISGVAFDSREVGTGDLFIALTGETTDGHKFVDKALGAGAAGVLVSQPVDGPHILVPDTTEALNALGAASRARMAGKVIGVTGSVGKTSVKEMLFEALARFRPGKAHRSLKSYNNHVGVPLSLARMPRDTLFGVFEMGMNHAGELSALTRLVRPDVAIVTAIAPAHIEFFNSEEDIARAKAEIFEGLGPHGVAIVPHDSPHYALLHGKAEQHAERTISFGMKEGADVRASEAVPSQSGGTLVSAHFPEAELCFTIAAPGEHQVSNALAVVTAVEMVGGDLAAAGLALAEMAGLPGRGARMAVPLTSGTALMIDESYNANPLSMTATIRQLGREQASRRVAVLGAMKELGDRSASLHSGLADPVQQAEVDMAILVGEEMQPLAKALEGKVMLQHVADAQAATAALRSFVQPGDAILVKGSNSVGLSRLVAELASGD